MNSFTAFAFILFCISTQNYNFNIGYEGWAGIFFIAIISTAVAVITLSMAIKIIGPAKVSIISTFEPVEGVLLSILFLNEQFNANQIIGTLFILSSIILINVAKGKNALRII